MEYIQMNNEVQFSRIIQGLWRLDSWNLTPEELVQFIEERIELGVTTFDTAEIYGNYTCEALFGEALKLKPELRSKIQIVTKTGINMKSDKRDYSIGHYDTRYDKIIASCKASIELMHCEYLDCFLIHREDPCIDHYEVARALEDLKQQGLIKSYGVSNFDPFKFDALHYATNQSLVTNQIEVSPLCYEHFDSGMMDLLGKLKISPMIWSPLAQGRIFTSNEEPFVRVRNVLESIANRHHTTAETIAYAYLMYHPVKMMPIVGSSKIDRLKNALAALDLSITHEEWFEIYTASGRQLR